MKIFAFSAVVALLFPLCSFGQDVAYSCQPSEILSPAIQLQDGNLLQIKSVSIPAVKDVSQYRVNMILSVVTMLDQLNSPNGHAAAKDVLVAFKVKDVKSGSLLELGTNDLSEVTIDALFLELGNFDVETDGPIPDGTYSMKIALGFVASRFSMNDPLLFKKIVLNCAVNVKN